MNVTKRALVAAIFTALHGVSAQAVSLGDAEVRSFLGQPLLVRIALPGSRLSDVESLRARIGDAQDFERLSLEYHYDTHALQVKPVERDGKWVLEVRSDEPFKQPIVQFPLKLDARDTRLMRAYTLLLDPPDYRFNPSSAQTRAASVKATSQPAPVPPGTRYTPYTYPVGDGETLWPIAAEFKPLNTSTPRMMRAILRANPDAFIDGDIDRLRSGSVLRIPEVSWGQVRAYERPEGGTPTFSTENKPTAEPAQTAVEPEQADVTSSDITLTEPLEEQPQIAVVGKENVQDASPADYLQQQVYLTHEEFEKNRLEQEEIRKQLKHLSEELAQLQRLMKLKDQQIIALQEVVESQKLALANTQAAVEKETPNSVKLADPAPKTQAQPALLPDKPVTTAKTKPEQGFPWWIAILLIVALPIAGWALWARRTREEDENIVLAELPEISNAPPAPYTDEVSAHAKKDSTAEEDQAEDPAPTGGPARDEDEATAGDSPYRINDSLAELTNSFPDLGESKTVDSGATHNDEDDEQITEDELAELAEQLSRELESDFADSDTEIIPGNVTADIDEDLGEKLNPLGETEESLPVLDLEENDAYDEIDESLDMARAYMVVGDNSSAVAILEQALQVTNEPEKRQRIEELLAQAS